MTLDETKHEPLKLKESYYLFQDILGFSEEISYNYNNKTSEKHLNEFYQAIKSTLKDLKYGLRGWNIRMFTDNIVLAKPIDGDGEDEFGDLIFS